MYRHKAANYQHRPYLTLNLQWAFLKERCWLCMDMQSHPFWSQVISHLNGLSFDRISISQKEQTFTSWWIEFWVAVIALISPLSSFHQKIIQTPLQTLQLCDDQLTILFSVNDVVWNKTKHKQKLLSMSSVTHLNQIWIKNGEPWRRNLVGISINKDLKSQLKSLPSSLIQER